MFKTIRTKILASNGLLLLILLLVLGFALVTLQQNQKLLNEQDQIFKAEQEVVEIDRMYADLSYWSLQFLVLLQDEAKANRDAIYARLVEQLSGSEDEARSDLGLSVEIYFLQMDEATNYFINDERIAGSQALNLANETAEKIHADLAVMVNQERRLLLSVIREVRQANHRISVALYVLLAAMIIVGLGMSLFLARMISGAIDSLRQTMESIERTGDLTSRAAMSSRDEIGLLAASFNELIGNLAAIVRDVKTKSEELATSSSQMTSVSIENSNNVTRQQEEVTAVASASEEMMTSIRQVSENANHTSSTIRAASTRAERGKKQVDQVVESIDQLAQEVASAEAMFQKVVDAGERIGGISGAIQGITRQTNMLALNAAIEAAKAGEHGSGFAVVASEVRDLARRTHEATAEIQEMIADLQSTSREAGEAMERGRRQSSASVSMVNVAGELIGENFLAMQQVERLATQISEATHQQSEMSKSVNGNLSSIIDVADQALASSREIQQASAMLLRMADSLKDSTDRFSV